MPMFHHEVDLYYTQLGEGTTIVFCHGAGGNAASWFNQFGAFKDDYHCVAYDCRGFGRSVCSVDEFDGSKFGSDAIALLDHLEIESAHFVCQSMGGWTGVQVGEFNQLPQGAVGDALFNEANLVSVERAQTLKLPILIFSGTDDVLWPPAVLQELAELLPTAERFEIDSGHSPYFENPEAFNRVLAEFLAR